MFGMSLTEILMILVIGLVVMGPDKIPEAARFMGKVMREIRKASNLLRDAMVIEDVPGFGATPLKSGTAAASVTAATFRDPDPRLDVRMVEMRPMTPSTPTAVELALADPPVAHREVYLHVPYDETI